MATGSGNVRVVDKTELLQVSPDATAKTHFVIVDCVGVTQSALSDTQPLDRKRHESLKNLLEHVAAGGTDLDVLSSLAARLARLERACTKEERGAIAEAAGGLSLGALAGALVAAIDPDRHVVEAQAMFKLDAKGEPTPEQIKKAAVAVAKEAAKPLATRPDLRKKLLAVHTAQEQIVDHINIDELLLDKTGFSQEAKERAMSVVASFEQYLADHKDEIDALKLFYSVPHAERLRFKDSKELAGRRKRGCSQRKRGSGPKRRRWGWSAMWTRR